MLSEEEKIEKRHTTRRKQGVHFTDQQETDQRDTQQVEIFLKHSLHYQKSVSNIILFRKQD
jgi:hypothetical protein